MSNSIVGVIGGSIGADPFDRRALSGASYLIFGQFQRQGRLHRAFGADVPRAKRHVLMLKNYHRSRETWRKQFYLDTAYYNALTQAMKRCMLPDDYEHGLLQIGAQFNLAQVSQGRCRCFSFHDGNLVQALQSPVFPKNVSTRCIDHALAYEREVYHSMDRVFAMSEYLRQSFINDFDVPAEKVITVGGGINLETIPDVPENKRYDSQEILFIGVEFERKGGWDVLHAFKALSERLPNAKLHIVGPRKLTIPIELQRGVEYHGYLSKSDPQGQKQLADLFQRCCLFVMPSLYEPFGSAPLEAMVYQIPSIVTNGWALKEMVVPGETGDLVERGNVEDLEVKMHTYLTQPGLLQRMGIAGRQMVQNRYTWSHVTQRIIAALPPNGSGSY